MTIELGKTVRDEAIASLQRYFQQHMDEPLGNLGASALLGFFLEEIGPAIYNRGVIDAQQRMQERVAEIDIEVHEEAFQYWHKHGKAAKKRGA